MKSECEIRVMRAELEAQLENVRREILDMGISTIESTICLASYEVRIDLLKEILETEENDCY